MLCRLKSLFFKNNYINQLNAPSSDLDKSKKLVQKTLKIFGDDYRKMDAELHDAIVRKEFSIKIRDPKYQMVSKIANKVFKMGMEITEGKNLEWVVLAHPNQYNFLASPKHFLGKHIQVMQDNWGMTGCKIQYADGALTFHDGQVLSQMMEEAKKNPKMILNLDGSGLRREHVELKPSFKRAADGNYYIGVTTACPFDGVGLKRFHTWFRLQDADGNVYSLGKLTKKVEKHRIFGTEEALFMTSDRYEWMAKKDDVKEVKLRVAKEKFDAFVRDLKGETKESLQKDSPKAEFNFMGDNCTDFAMRMLDKHEMVRGDDRQMMYKTRVHRRQFLFPRTFPIDKTIKSLFRKFPKTIRRPVKFLRKRIVEPILDLPIRLVIASMGLKRENPLTKDLSIAHPYPFRLWLDGFAKKQAHVQPVEEHRSRVLL